VFVTDSQASFADIPPGGSVTSEAPHFAFTLGAAATCPGALDFEVDLVSSEGSWTEPLQLSLGSGGIQTDAIASTTTPLPIPDDAVMTDAIVVSAAGKVVDLDVALTIPHRHAADLDVFLIAPTGERVELTTDNGGSDDDYIGTVFDDAAATSISAASPPFTGTFQPETPLAALNDLPAAGTWTLEVSDDAAADTGMLEAWSLILTSATTPACSACPVAPPGEVAALEWVGVDGLQWTAVAESRWYELLRGSFATVAALLDAATDSCIRWTGTDAFSGPVLGELPPSDRDFYWYLVGAWNGGGRGAAGSGSAAPRVIDPSGACP
jgi:subtilisin-like proprotein convertase family protein